DPPASGATRRRPPRPALESPKAGGSPSSLVPVERPEDEEADSALFALVSHGCALWDEDRLANAGQRALAVLHDFQPPRLDEQHLVVLERPGPELGLLAVAHVTAAELGRARRRDRAREVDPGDKLVPGHVLRRRATWTRSADRTSPT